ncbi:MAG: glycosyltransferase family 2 protein [Kiritimatiellae bacterium]|nr:glycosyltransferase family 2 protein [Kiritimatiellia bacterium]
MARVSVIIPCRNEKDHVGKLLESLLAQSTAPHEMEILVADGMSEDGTREILEEYARRDARIRIFDNPERNTVRALALLLEKAGGDYIVRLDAHARCPPDYVSTLVRYLEEKQADNVGGVIQAVPANKTVRARAIAICMNSPFGVGASFRTIGGFEAVEVETVPFGAWRRDHFAKYGPFDPTFVRAQDLEHNIRVRRRGGRILCLPWLVISYAGRATFAQLARMGFQYGYWKIPVRLKHPVRFAARQYLPPLALLGMLASIALAVVVRRLLVIPLAYLLLVGMFSVVEAVNAGRPHYAPFCFTAFVIMHMSYGAGYLGGLWDAWIRRRWRTLKPDRQEPRVM